MRLLRFGCITVVVLAVLAVIVAALGSRQPQSEQPQVASQNTAAPQVTEETDPLDGPPPQTPTATAEAPTPTAEPRPTREPRSPEQVAASNGRCQSVAPDVVAAIESGLTVTGGGSLRGAQAVRSRDYERVWFVAADLQGDGLEGDSDIAVWALNTIDAVSGPILSADAVAREFSDWGDADRSDRFGPGDDGMAEARACVSAAL